MTIEYQDNEMATVKLILVALGKPTYKIDAKAQKKGITLPTAEKIKDDLKKIK